ncbi:cytochrome c family protein [uncultured Cohaesibacter sp.]|uniref:cytochrome c family protein n=1 Tax=uncultured Cohaesibacter sp. TaxID=1002546 RepID=UPI0029C944F5|nr:cytochrome c family protein [uncultured Cohaesibacter sp.]
MKKMIAIASLALLTATGAALAEGDAAKGEKVFNKCKACHQVGEGAKNKVGPVLNGVIGRKIASAEDFKYSKAFLEKAEAEPDFVWTEEAINEYLTKPKDYIKKNKMAFAGLKKDDDRADVIAYLKTFSE